MVVTEAGASRGTGGNESPISKGYFWAAVSSLIAAFLAVTFTLTLLFQPLVILTNNLALDGGAKPKPVIVNAEYIFPSAVIGVLISLTAVALAVNAFGRDSRRRWLWGILGVLAILVLTQACGLTFLAPKFVGLLKDLGAKAI